MSSRVGGIPEVVTPDTGRLFPAGDVEALAAALRELAADGELRARLGANARERAHRSYSASRLIGDVDALYEELLGG